MKIARYWAGEEPEALFGISKILMMAGGRPVAILLNLAYRLKKQVQYFLFFGWCLSFETGTFINEK